MKPLMMACRGKLCQRALRRALLADELALPPGQSSQQCLNLCNQLGRKEWWCIAANGMSMPPG